MEESKIASNLSRRQFLLLSGQGAIALAFLAGCGAAATPAPEAPAEEPAAESGGAEAEPAKAALTLEFLAWGDPADIEAWDKLSKLYMEKKPQCNSQSNQRSRSQQ